ncbi:MAG TPA: hypothetical protein VG148_11080 [Pyrinomonadaceae bacterium]|nr:hypothetical protein [Pyrinomonadaceae bacterium]
MTEQEYRVRECVHRARGAAGDFYNGAAYVRYLQRLRSAAAVSFAGKVTSFFWADAAHVLVWLCRDCAAEIGIREN